MATRRNLTAVEAEPDTDSQYEHSEIEVRGTTYQFTELDSETYDECCELAKLENGNIDTVLLLKIMLPKSLVSPRLSEKQLLKMPMGLRRALLTEVDRLHFPLDALAPPTRPGESASATSSSSEAK